MERYPRLCNHHPVCPYEAEMYKFPAYRLLAQPGHMGWAWVFWIEGGLCLCRKSAGVLENWRWRTAALYNSLSANRKPSGKMRVVHHFVCIFRNFMTFVQRLRNRGWIFIHLFKLCFTVMSLFISHSGLFDENGHCTKMDHYKVLFLELTATALFQNDKHTLKSFVWLWLSNRNNVRSRVHLLSLQFCSDGVLSDLG